MFRINIKLLSNPVAEQKIRENDSHCRSIVLKTMDRSIVKQLEKEKNSNFNVENCVVLFIYWGTIINTIHPVIVKFNSSMNRIKVFLLLHNRWTLFCISFFRYTFGKPVSGKATLRIKRKYQYRHWGWREEPQRKTIDSIEQSFPVTITILILSSTSLFRYKYIEGFCHHIFRCRSALVLAQNGFRYIVCALHKTIMDRMSCYMYNNG